MIFKKCRNSWKRLFISSFFLPKNRSLFPDFLNVSANFSLCRKIRVQIVSRTSIFKRLSPNSPRLILCKLYVLCDRVVYFTDKLDSERKISAISAISRLDAGSSDSLLTKHNKQGGIRDVTDTKKESEILRKKDREDVPLTSVMRSNFYQYKDATS